MNDAQTDETLVEADSFKEVAERLKSWAAEQGILTYQPPDDLYEKRHNDLNDLADLDVAAAAIGVSPTARSIMLR